MRTLVYSLLALCILQAAVSQSCSGGFYATPSPPDPTKGICTACHPMCKQCTTTTCATFIDKANGLDKTVLPGSVICSGANTYVGTAVGYNKLTDSCEPCEIGCATCLIDTTICGSCKGGYDYDRTNGQCIRATLGLAAVVLALSALILIVVIITCICACKL